MAIRMNLIKAGKDPDKVTREVALAHAPKVKYKLHGRTKQSYKDSCDINKILEQNAGKESLSHLERHGARYGDFAAIDWEELPLQLAQGREIFGELPAEVKREFNQSPGEFFAYVSDPKNSERLQQLLPAIAQRGAFFPKVNQIETRTQDPEPEKPTPDPEPDPSPDPAPAE